MSRDCRRRQGRTKPTPTPSHASHLFNEEKEEMLVREKKRKYFLPAREFVRRDSSPSSSFG